MKKIMNSSVDFVMEMCQGIAYVNPELEFLKKYKVMSKKNRNVEKVSLISGGGSGHEPAHAGFVGEGMLDAAVCGDVFASPSQIQVYQAIKETAGSRGTLLIIKNYSGDMMNFKNGAALAEDDGLTVDYVKVDDDIAVDNSLYTVGRRGVAGTVLVHKIAGAAAEEGRSLAEVKAVAEKAIHNVKSLGFALSSCTVPAKGTPTFAISDGEMEFGVGIHGEPGVSREKTVSADELTDRIMQSLVKALLLAESDEIALLVNGFGGTPLQELYVLNNSAMKWLNQKGIKVSYLLVGNYMTSIDMTGASISVMKLDEELKKLLRSPCSTPALKQKNLTENISVHFEEEDNTAKEHKYEIEVPISYAVIKNQLITMENIIFMVDAMSVCAIKNEVHFCEIDSVAGDGDFGMSLAKGFRQLKREFENILAESQDIGTFLSACGLIIMEYCGGASGPIWGSAFRAAGKQAGNQKQMDVKSFADMLQAAVKGIQLTGERSFGRGAVVGDKTLIDALVPAADFWSRCGESMTELDLQTVFEMSAKKAVDGAKKTEEIAARMGRAGTVGERSIGFPDAGAYGIAVLFTEISKKLAY